MWGCAWKVTSIVKQTTNMWHSVDKVDLSTCAETLTVQIQRFSRLNFKVTMGWKNEYSCLGHVERLCQRTTDRKNLKGDLVKWDCFCLLFWNVCCLLLCFQSGLKPEHFHTFIQACMSTSVTGPSGTWNFNYSTGCVLCLCVLYLSRGSIGLTVARLVWTNIAKYLLIILFIYLLCFWVALVGSEIGHTTFFFCSFISYLNVFCHNSDKTHVNLRDYSKIK